MYKLILLLYLFILRSQLNTATSVSNLESEYLEEENGQPAKPSHKAASATSEKKNVIDNASNKRMRSANINTWTLRYNDESLESKVNYQLH